MKKENYANAFSVPSLITIARDVHFWIPLLVLLAGLLVLHMLR